MRADPERFSFTVAADDAGKRVDLFLTQSLPDASRAQVQRAAAADAVLVNGKPVRVSYRVRAGEKVQIDLVRPEDTGAQPEAEQIPLNIVYSDDAIIVVNKAAGMVVHPAAGHRSGTLVNALLGSNAFSDEAMAPSDRPGIVHRLDKDTSGLLIVARTELAHRKLADQLKERTLKRLYLTVAWGHFRTSPIVFEGAIGRSPTDRKRMTVRADGRAAKTNVTLLEQFDVADLLEVALDTGRTHQIRVHLSMAGHPVVGDTVYGGGDGHLKGILPSLRLFGRRMVEAIGRPALHAQQLELIHPVSGKPMKFKADPPRDFLDLLDLCRHTPK